MSKLIALWQATLHQLRFFLVVLLGYLVQVCVMPYLKVGDVVPSMLYAVIAVLTVGYGKLRAFWAGGVYGILMETMLPTLPMLNLVLYPVGAMFVSIFFADKSESKLEEERSLGRTQQRRTDLMSMLIRLRDLVRGEPGRNASPYIRTPLCAGMNVLIYEIVNLTYMYLGGAELGNEQYARALTNILATVAVAIVIMLPARRFLGFRKTVQEKRPTPRY